MQLLTFEAPDGLRLGIRTPAGIIDVPQAAAAFTMTEVPSTPAAFFERGSDALDNLRALVERASGQPGDPNWLLEEQDLRLGPCVPQPGKVICVGLNYRKHAAEAGMDEPESPVLFSKFNNAIAAGGDSVPLTDELTRVDYEAELVAVIGKTGKRIAEADALDHVLGYCNGNDISDRRLQNRTSQWLLGKTPDKFLPIGPYLVTADEVGDPQKLGIRCWLNGDLRQDSNTADMIFNVAQIISYASRFMTLEPGDVISTGTPEGVILGREERVWMQPGDETLVEIDGLGRLVNRMVAETT